VTESLYQRSIIDVMENPPFAALFRDKTWDSWKVFLRALFALEMTDEQLAVYREFTGRTNPPSAPFKEAEAIVGRRGGKSRIMAWIASYLALYRDYRPYLAPGEKVTIAVIAADRKQARSILRYITGLFNGNDKLKRLIEDEGTESLSLRNRVVIEIATASFRVTRGYTFAAVLADETAYWRDETSANPDVEIFRALRPGLSTIPGALLLNASSPYRRAGLLWTTYQRHYGKDDARVLVWKASTAQMNAGIDPDIIAEAFEEDPESAACEYGGEFRSDLADFVPRAAIEACVEFGCFERPPARSVIKQYFMFLDAAGGSGTDSMVAAISHMENGIAVLDAVRERKPPFSPSDVVAEFTEMAKSYGIHRCESDKWGGDWVGEAFRKKNITVVPCAKPKSQIYIDALPLIMSRKCNLIENQRMISQFASLERRTARGGRDTVDHPPNAHDDVANACAGALLMASTGRQPMKIDPALLDKITPIPGSAGWHRRHGW
jgi:hypothetical protein